MFLQDPSAADEPPSHQQDDHATDEEKLASSTSQKWAALHDVDAELNSDQQDFPQPCDLTSFVNENSLPHQAPGEASCVQIKANRHQSMPQTGGAQMKVQAYVWINHAATSHFALYSSSNTIDLSCGSQICLLAQFSIAI